MGYLSEQNPTGLSVVTCHTETETFYGTEIFSVGGTDKEVTTVEVKKKIPKGCLDQIVEYFRRDLTKESLARVYYKDGRFVVDYPPLQAVTAVMVGFSNPEGGKGLLALEIHSHNTMRAFWSSVDNRDEIFPGIYGVIGCLDCAEPEMRFRVVYNGNTKALQREDLFRTTDKDVREYRRIVAETTELTIAKIEGLGGKIGDEYLLKLAHRFIRLSKSLGFENLRSGLKHHAFDYDYEEDHLIIYDEQAASAVASEWIKNFASENCYSAQDAARYEMGCFLYARLRSGQYELI